MVMQCCCASNRCRIVNSSDSSIVVHANCGDSTKDLYLGPHVTERHLIDQPVKVSSKAAGNAVACTFKADGPLSALRLSGFILGPSGYTAPIRFYDLKTASSPTLTAVGLDTSAHTVAVVKNVSDAVVVVTPRFAELKATRPYTRLSCGAPATVVNNPEFNALSRNLRL